MTEALDALTAAKPAFPGTEAELLALLTNARLRRGDIAWLEVGAGDGRNLKFLLNRLSAGRAIRAVAVDPAPVQPAQLERVEWIRSRIEDYRLDRAFDWISMRHTAYYIADPLEEIARLTGSLAVGGALALTHWGGDCILRRLHVGMCGDNGEMAMAGVEDLARELTAVPSLDVSAAIVSCTALDARKVLSDAIVCAALAKLVCRGRPRLRPDIDPAREAADLLKRLSDRGIRRNGIVFVKSRQ